MEKYLDYEGLRYTFEVLDKHIKDICDNTSNNPYEAIHEKITNVVKGFKKIMVASGENCKEAIAMTEDQIIPG